MQGITLKNGQITYYGNPVGYMEKGTAIVDSSFQTNELSQWLQSRQLPSRWTDGVMERLLTVGQFAENTETAAPLKNVRIWQLRPETNIYMKFISLDERTGRFGEPVQPDYQVVFDGQLGTNDLELIYERCNMEHPSGYMGHSLSMSDVVELYDVSGSDFYYCDRFDFKQISFIQEEQTQGMEYTMNQSF